MQAIKSKTYKIKARVPMGEMLARFDQASVNVEKRTVDMTFTTSTPVRMIRWDWNSGYEQINEILSMDPAHIRLERMQNGAPLLNNHSRWDLRDQIGVVERVWIEGEKLRGTVRFSKRPDADEIFKDVVDGVIRNGSVGYKVHNYKDETKEGDKLKTKRAIDWEPMEMSLVPIGADPKAGVRAEQETFECEIETEIEIENQTERTAEMKTQPTTESKENKEVNTIEADKIRQEEREKNAKIMRACRQAKLPETFAEQLVNSGKSLVDCLEKVQEKWAEVDAQRSVKPAAGVKVDVSGDLDETKTRREAVAEAILARTAPGDFKMTERAQRFQGRTALETARQILEFNGVRTDMMGPNEIVQRAFQSTSDFSAILEDVAHKRLEKAYQAVPQIFRKFGVEGTLPDFKPQRVANLGEADDLQKVGEGGEITIGKIGDSKEIYALATYGKGLAVTRQTIINDDLGAFGKLAAAFGRAAAALENRVAIVETLINNPLMGDNKALFHADHKNISTPAGAPTESTIDKLMALMAKQVDDKGRIMELEGKYLIADTDHRVAVSKVLNATTVANGADNVMKGLLEPLFTGQMGGNKHILVADPNRIEGLEYAYLEGARGIQIETKDHADTLGVVVRCYLDFAAKVINYRAFAWNAGA